MFLYITRICFHRFSFDSSALLSCRFRFFCSLAVSFCNYRSTDAHAPNKIWREIRFRFFVVARLGCFDLIESGAGKWHNSDEMNYRLFSFYCRLVFGCVCVCVCVFFCSLIASIYFFHSLSNHLNMVSALNFVFTAAMSFDPNGDSHIIISLLDYDLVFSAINANKIERWRIFFVLFYFLYLSMRLRLDNDYVLILQMHYAIGLLLSVFIFSSPFLLLSGCF